MEIMQKGVDVNALLGKLVAAVVGTAMGWRLRSYGFAGFFGLNRRFMGSPKCCYNSARTGYPVPPET